MNSKSLWITIVAAVFSFVAGFYFANTFNRGELDTLRSENERLKASPQANSNQTPEQTLSDAEIRAKIEEADKNSGNFQFQKNLGLALYRYGTIKQDGKLLKDALRILQRADTLNGQDREIKITIGNTYFDIAYFDKLKRSATADVINKNFDDARKYYDQALSLKPDDVGVITDIGLTYFLEEPAEYKKAADELAKALKVDPNHERAIQFMVETKWRLGAIDEAAAYLEQLRTKFPGNPMIGELTSMITKSPASP
jgi:tetratricopeptide (TPR) repeat protein